MKVDQHLLQPAYSLHVLQELLPDPLSQVYQLHAVYQINLVLKAQDLIQLDGLLLQLKLLGR